VPKLAYVLWAGDGGSPRELGRRLLDAAPRLLDVVRGRLALNVADVEADTGPSMPLAREGGIAGLVTACVDEPAGAAARHPLEGVLAGLGGRLAGWRVSESVPLAYPDRDWPDGTVSPGVKLLTLFDKPAGLSDADFFAEWHGVHTPLSLEIHPLWCYVRNVVEEAVTPDTPRFRGIVEEQFRALEDVLDPKRLYGSRENARRVAEHVPRFIELRSMETALLTEHILRSSW
jgi:hypothetical protein